MRHYYPNAVIMIKGEPRRFYTCDAEFSMERAKKCIDVWATHGGMAVAWIDDGNGHILWLDCYVN